MNQLKRMMIIVIVVLLVDTLGISCKMERPENKAVETSLSWFLLSGGATGDPSEAPSALSYLKTSAVYTTNLRITDNRPVYSGNVQSWSVEPSLPDGLEIDNATGIISGTPVTEQRAKEYLITASNNYGTATAVVSITVNNLPPVALTYALTSAVYTKDLPIIVNEPTVTGTVSSWSISPSLPEGLVMDPSTGIISGTPVKEQSAVYYTITAENSGGSTTAQMSIVINLAAPSNLSYSQPTFVYTKGIPISDNKPSVSGTVASWSITPDLPAGLHIDSSTGIISGTPYELCAEAEYTLKAENSGGEATAVIKITVNDLAPSALSYAPESVVFTVGEDIGSYSPSVTGTVSSWSVTPALPEGLTLNTTTGIISGIASIEQSSKAYTVKATNTGGSTSTVITIAVSHNAPSGLSYSTQNSVYTKGVRIANIPTVTGTVTSWSVTPALPRGLILNTTTGAITGIPELLQAKKSYTVIAMNSGGSTSTTISIKVNDVAPAGVVYMPHVCQLGTRIIVFTFHGHLPSEISLTPIYQGTITSWSIDKALPAGVTLNAATGLISGNGLAEPGSTTKYTITASNSGGSVSTVITINGPPP